LPTVFITPYPHRFLPVIFSSPKFILFSITM
jgi:hypothetical protein